MRHAVCWLVLVLVALAGPAAAAPTLVAPVEGGVVLGDRLVIEVKDAGVAPDLRLDGAVLMARWQRLPYARRWAAEVQVGRGAHRLEVRTAGGGRWSGVRFTTAASTGEVADRIATHILARRPPDSMKWSWGSAVALLGLHRWAHASPAAQRATLLDAVGAFHRAHEARGLPRIDHPDVAAPGLSALLLLQEDGDPSGAAAVDRVASWLRAEPRNAIGALDHLGARSVLRTLAWLSVLLRPWARSIWVDSLVMYGLFAARHADPALRDFGLAQPGIFARALQDPATGLFVHAWDVPRRRPLGERWLRGNGWAAFATAEMLELTPAGHPERARLEHVLRAVGTGLLARQLPTGLWDTLCEPGAAYPETSGSALAACALARGARLGVLPPAARDAARRALQAIVARLEPRPRGLSVTGTSIATNPTPALLYRLTPRQDDVDYGVGAVLLLAAELAQEAW